MKYEKRGSPATVLFLVCNTTISHSTQSCFSSGSCLNTSQDDKSDCRPVCLPILAKLNVSLKIQSSKRIIKTTACHCLSVCQTTVFNNSTILILCPLFKKKLKQGNAKRLYFEESISICFYGFFLVSKKQEDHRSYCCLTLQRCKSLTLWENNLFTTFLWKQYWYKHCLDTLTVPHWYFMDIFIQMSNTWKQQSNQKCVINYMFDAYAH